MSEEKDFFKTCFNTVAGLEDKIYPSMVIRSQAEAIELLEEENKQLKAKLEMYENGVYYSSENDKLENEIDNLNYIIDKQDKDITILSKGNKQLKDVIEEAREYIEDWLFNAGGNGASMNYEDINELLQILDKVKD